MTKSLFLGTEKNEHHKLRNKIAMQEYKVLSIAQKAVSKFLLEPLCYNYLLILVD